MMPWWLFGYTHREHVCNPALPRYAAWVTTPDRHWIGRCDDCGRRRLFTRLYDVHPPEFGTFGFWWVCSDCLIWHISEIAVNPPKDDPVLTSTHVGEVPW